MNLLSLSLIDFNFKIPQLMKSKSNGLISMWDLRIETKFWINIFHGIPFRLLASWLYFLGLYIWHIPMFLHSVGPGYIGNFSSLGFWMENDIWHSWTLEFNWWVLNGSPFSLLGCLRIDGFWMFSTFSIGWFEIFGLVPGFLSYMFACLFPEKAQAEWDILRSMFLIVLVGFDWMRGELRQSIEFDW